MKYWHIAAMALATALVVSGGAFPGEATKNEYRLFILHSYEQGHICGQPQEDGVVQALKDLGFRPDNGLRIQNYYMDTKRNNNTPDLMAEQGQIAVKLVKEFKPDVLITLDDNAFREAALKLVDTDIPIVFCGMNQQPEKYNEVRTFLESRIEPGHNVTGVYEKLHIADAIRVHDKIVPGLKKIVILTGPSPTGKALETQIQLELGDADIPCKWELKNTASWEEYQQEILAADKDLEVGAIYPGALMLKDKDGKTYTAPDILKWTTENCIKPGLAINYAFTRLGLFGGAAVDFYSMGGQAGAMAARIIMGEKPGEIPIEEAERYALVFNLERANKLGIEIPEDILLAADDIVLRSSK